MKSGTLSERGSMTSRFMLPQGLGMNRAFESLLLNAAYDLDVNLTREMVVVLAPGGGSCGTVTAGQVGALQHIGLAKGVSKYLGASTGVVSEIFAIAGQANIAEEAYPVICGDPSFVRFHRRGAVAVGDAIRAIEGLSYNGVFRLDLDAFYASPTEAWAIVARRNGEVDLINLKTVPNLFEAIHAVMALPSWFYGKRVVINGVSYGDAAIVEPLAIEQAKQLFPVDPDNKIRKTILLAANRALPLPQDLLAVDDELEGRSVRVHPVIFKRWRAMKRWLDELPLKALEFLVYNFILWDNPPEYRRRAKQARSLLRSRLEDAIYEEGDIHFAILPTPDNPPMSPFTTDRVALEDATIEASNAVYLEYYAFLREIRSLGPFQWNAPLPPERVEELVANLKLRLSEPP